MNLIERLRATNKRVRHSQELRDEAADALEQVQKYAPYPGDQALAGESMPPIKSILDLIRYCTTIHNRFGNTCVDNLSLKWGGSALNYKGELQERIEQLEIVGEEIAQDRNTANDRLSEARKRITQLEAALRSESCENKRLLAAVQDLLSASDAKRVIEIRDYLIASEELAPDTCPECHGTRKTVINKHVGVEDCPVCGRDDGEGQAAALSEIDR